MGDRVNVAVQDNAERVYLYAHWCGYDAPEIVRKALDRARDRWNDPPYLTRAIFCEFVAESDNLKGTTGYGISTRPADNEYPFIIVDCDKQQVRIEADTRDGFDCSPDGEPQAYSFRDYAALPEAGWSTLDPAQDNR